jgi:LmbE family N-acetylglucosaminyl deacetylase
MKIVSIMAHADDEMRCLGTMLKCRARGDALAFVTVADGSVGFAHDPAISREAAAAVRAGEMRSLCKAIGAEFFTLGQRDGFLYDHEALREELIRTIRKAAPDVIFTHYHDDYNSDHTVVSSMVRHCCMLASYPREMNFGTAPSHLHDRTARTHHLPRNRGSGHQRLCRGEAQASKSKSSFAGDGNAKGSWPRLRQAGGHFRCLLGAKDRV